MTRLLQFARRRKLLTSALLAIVVAAVTIAIIGAANAPASSGVRVAECVRSDGGACVRFPSVTGTNLIGEPLALPGDFSGTLTFVLVSFDEGQTARTSAWLPLARELADEYPQFVSYGVPVLPSVDPLVRTFITAGMVLVVPEDVRAVTIMLFLEDINLFLDALDIDDVDAPQSLLLNDAGEVLWRVRGEYSEDAAASLREAVGNLSPP